MLQCRPASSVPRHHRAVHVAQAVLLVTNMTLFLEHAQLCSHGGVGGAARELTPDLSGGGAPEAVRASMICRSRFVSSVWMGGFICYFNNTDAMKLASAAATACGPRLMVTSSLQKTCYSSKTDDQHGAALRRMPLSSKNCVGVGVRKRMGTDEHSCHHTICDPLDARSRVRHAMPAGGDVEADNGNGTFSNPLFYDEFSDRDLIRVGDDFYLTGTTMHSMPGLPDPALARSGELALPRLRARPARSRPGVPPRGRQARLRPGHLGAELPLSQRHVPHLQQRQRPDDAAVPCDQSRGAVDAHAR